MVDKNNFDRFEKEVAYQKHMLENLGRWFSLLFLVASIGVVLICSFYKSGSLPFFLGISCLILGLICMVLFGYGIYKGRANLNKFVEYMAFKLSMK